ncbi:MAG: hypothetical protein ACK421_03150 [Pseudanabaenaceae cyanobacterium]
MAITFQFNRRCYTCYCQTNQPVPVLRIRNHRGELLVVEKGNPLATVVRDKRTEVIDLRDKRYSHFFNLIRMAVVHLEMAEKNNLLTEKDKAIANLSAQLAILEERYRILAQQQNNIPREIQNRLAKLEQGLHIKHQENIQLQQKIQQIIDTDQSSDAHIAAVVKASLESIWSALTETDRRDLILAAKHCQQVEARGFGASLGDYKEAGMRLSGIPERIVRFIMKNFMQYAERTGNWEIIRTLRENNRVGKETLGSLPRLVCQEWYTYDERVLQQETLPEEDYCNLYRLKKISEEENNIYAFMRPHFQRFVETWEYPGTKWLRQSITVASTIDKIRLLRNLAIHGDAFYRWQYAELKCLVCGGTTIDDRKEIGLLPSIYV